VSPVLPSSAAALAMDKAQGAGAALSSRCAVEPQLVPACALRFLQDSQDPNPLIRALAVRTMGCIRVDRITEYLCDPLQRCIKVRTAGSSMAVHLLPAVNNPHQRRAGGSPRVKDALRRFSPRLLPESLVLLTAMRLQCDSLCPCSCAPQDDDPYVRKTAAICIAKLYDINAELVEDRGFLDALTEMVSDSNPMVVANAVAALSEIQEGSSKPVFEITSSTVFKLLAALNECTE